MGVCFRNQTCLETPKVSFAFCIPTSSDRNILFHTCTWISCCQCFGIWPFKKYIFLSGRQIYREREEGCDLPSADSLPSWPQWMELSLNEALLPGVHRPKDSVIPLCFPGWEVEQRGPYGTPRQRLGSPCHCTRPWDWTILRGVQ